jgi:AraC-like DNA-binding protein
MGALEVQSKLKERVNDNSFTNLKIGLSVGLPVTGNKTIFEDTIKLAERLCRIANNKIVLSSEVKDLSLNENLNTFMNKAEVLALSTSDEAFINHLMDFIEKEWENANIKVADFNKPLGLSKSQLYRKMILLTGISPNNFLREYRLNRALDLLNKKTLTISEIAYDTGFSSLSYFSKCFLNHFGLLPSDYLRTVE